MSEPNDLRGAVDGLARAARILERTLRDMSLADFRMLSSVAAGEARASRLADRLALGKPTVSASVDSLVRRGLLVREPSEVDQRATVLSITPEGRRLLDEGESALTAVVGGLAADTEDPAATLAALAGFGDAIERRWVAISAKRAAGRTGRHVAEVAG